MSSTPMFSDRVDAGEHLAISIKAELAALYAGGVSASPIVYALPRGGIPVAVPVARCLDCPLDILAAKKITQPDNPELAIGAVTSDGHVLWFEPAPLRKQKKSQREVVLANALKKAQALQDKLSPSCPSISPKGAIAILVDDGIATGMTIAAAAKALRAQQPALIWICAPVAPQGLSDWLQQWCDRVIILGTPNPFLSVSRFYASFPQVETSEVIAYLQQHNQQRSPDIQPTDTPRDG